LANPEKRQMGFWKSSPKIVLPGSLAKAWDEKMRTYCPVPCFSHVNIPRPLVQFWPSQWHSFYKAGRLNASSLLLKLNNKEQTSNFKCYGEKTTWVGFIMGS
jgi:hypothetical protein